MFAAKKDVRRALEAHQDRLERLPNVVGLGVTEDPVASAAGQVSFVVTVYVSKKVSEVDLLEHERVPKQLQTGGKGSGVRVPTRVIESGLFSKQELTMAPAPKRPPPPDIRPSCDGLIIQVGVRGQKMADALALAESVADTLPGKWSVASLGPGSDAFEVTRARKDKGIAINTAWSHTHRLRAHRDVRSAEPSLTLPGHDLPEELVAEFLTPQESMSAQSRLKPNKPKACAKNDFEWSLKLCEVDKALMLPLPAGGKHGGAGIVVGHPDTGYSTHPQIWDLPSRRRVLPAKGYDFADDDPDPTDQLQDGFLKQPGHGTATGSVIMSSKDAASPEGVSGVAPKARLIPIRVTPSVVLFSFGKLSKAIYHAVANNAHVISISLGGPFKSDTLQRALQFAVDQGVVVLAAAGNVWPWVVYPAKLPEVIAVGACDCERKPWKKTARGDEVDLAAPGAGVWRANIDANGVTTVGMGYGTSFAVATAAGACALWLSFHGRQKLITKYGKSNIAPLFKDLLLREGVDVPSNWKKDKDGEGVLNVLKLLTAAMPDTAPAGGMTGFETQSAGAADDLLRYFPDDDSGRIMDAALALFGVDQRNFALMMDELGDELLFHVSTNPEFRSAIQQRARSEVKLTKQTMRREAAKPGQARLKREASRQFRARCGI